VNNSTAALVQWLTQPRHERHGHEPGRAPEFRAQTPEISTCDADGNLTQDGFVELHLGWGESLDANRNADQRRHRFELLQRLDATYDYQGRRVRKQCRIGILPRPAINSRSACASSTTAGT